MSASALKSVVEEISGGEQVAKICDGIIADLKMWCAEIGGKKYEDLRREFEHSHSKPWHRPFLGASSTADIEWAHGSYVGISFFPNALGFLTEPVFGELQRRFSSWHQKTSEPIDKQYGGVMHRQGDGASYYNTCHGVFHLEHHGSWVKRKTELPFK